MVRMEEVNWSRIKSGLTHEFIERLINAEPDIVLSQAVKQFSGIRKELFSELPPINSDLHYKQIYPDMF